MAYVVCWRHSLAHTHTMKAKRLFRPAVFDGLNRFHLNGPVESNLDFFLERFERMAGNRWMPQIEILLTEPLSVLLVETRRWNIRAGSVSFSLSDDSSAMDVATPAGDVCGANGFFFVSSLFVIFLFFCMFSSFLQSLMHLFTIVVRQIQLRETLLVFFRPVLLLPRSSNLDLFIPFFLLLLFSFVEKLWLRPID